MNIINYQLIQDTCFLLSSPQGKSVTAGAAHIAPNNRFSSACLVIILWRVLQSRKRAAPGIPP